MKFTATTQPNVKGETSLICAPFAATQQLVDALARTGAAYAGVMLYPSGECKIGTYEHRVELDGTSAVAAYLIGRHEQTYAAGVYLPGIKPLDADRALAGAGADAILSTLNELQPFH